MPPIEKIDLNLVNKFKEHQSTMPIPTAQITPFIERILDGNRNVKRNTALNYARMLIRIIKFSHETWEDDAICDKILEMVKANQINPFIASVPASVGNTALTAVIVALSPNGRGEWVENSLFEPTFISVGEQLSKQLAERHQRYYQELEKQKKTPAQDKNWVDFEVLVSIRKKLKKEHLLYPNKKEVQQKYLVACLYTLLPPRRLEYASMTKISRANYKTANKEKNYIVGNKKMFFHFGDYKTFKKYGVQRIRIPKEIAAIIRKIQGENMLTTQKGKVMTKNYLTKFIQKTFQDTGKKISATMLRHIYLSHTFKNDATLENKKLLARAMGHSTSQQDFYTKH